MLIYYAKNFAMSFAGVRLVGVTCDRCGCEYAYEFARVGSGTATAPYGIGADRAAQAASDRAQRDLARRLERESELVPCPECLWVNDAMVAGYRLGRYRRGTGLAWSIGLAGTAASLVTAIILLRGPAPDRMVGPYVLTVGTAASATLAMAVLAGRQFLRGRTRPNRDYPLPPSLPPGSPVALRADPVTGEWVPAGPPRKPGTSPGPGAWVDLQLGRSHLPLRCCDCLGPGSPGSEYQYHLGRGIELDILLCVPCARRWTRGLWLGAAVAFALGLAVAVPLAVAWKPDEAAIWIGTAAVGIVVPMLGAMAAGRKVAPVRVKIVDLSRGVVRLWFRNKDFPALIATDGYANA